ncbi:CpaE family protein [Arthrobacter sp. NPDC090010]|uniref:AAA family ATPase n=1 Tax=Arthrobacter sp. NPDC090010 TaxID=3363942 RepID=UPI0037FB29C6
MTASVAVLGTAPSGLMDALESRRSTSLRVTRSCGSVEEILGACQAGIAQVALFLEGAELLDVTTVDRLRALGVLVVVCHGDPEERARLSGVGAVALPLEAGIERLEAVAAGTGQAIVPSSVQESQDSVPWPEAGPVDEAPGSRGFPDEGESGRGGKAVDDAAVDSVPRLLAVWGPAGAPGRTMVAVNLAAELALGGRRVLLMDLDTYGASIAASLGLLDESAGIALACRQADLGRFDVAALARIAVSVQLPSATFDVLSGITRAERWSELRAAALERVLRLCGTVYDHLVIDTGFCLEGEEEALYEATAPRRNEAALCALAHADRVYAVADSGPVGVPRLVRSLPRLMEVAPTADWVVLMNKVRKETSGRSPERQLREAWERFGPDIPIRGFLPFNPAIADSALREGTVLAESAPNSELRNALRAQLCAPAQRSRRSSVFYTTTRWLRSR